MVSEAFARNSENGGKLSEKFLEVGVGADQSDPPGLSRQVVRDDFDIDTLNEDDQIRVSQVLDEYLKSLEKGETFDVDEACRDDPQLLIAVRVYLKKLNALYGIVDSEQADAFSPPKRLGTFTLLREIGRGGMGIIYEATQAGIERRVALKLLPQAATFDARQIARFKNESRAAGGLFHPNIVPVYSVGEAEGVHFYAMQLIDGVSVDQLIEGCRLESGPRDWRTIVSWASDAASALHSAHETGVVHRDIKPSNLMIDSSEKVWVTDFGLARCQANRSLTQTGDVVGTMRYMSPEQARGQSAIVDGRSDIYSLAATVYEMLTLEPAHVGDDGPAILKRIDDGDVRPVRSLNPDLPRDLETVIAKAMSERRDDRYETAREFAEDLRRVLDGQPTVARPPSPMDRMARWSSKHQRAVIASVMIIAIGCIGFAMSTAKIAATAARLDDSEQLARGAVDRLGSQMAELLADIPAAQQVRRTLLRDTLEYYERFAAANHQNSVVRHELAVTYGKIGSIQRSLGSRDAEIAAFLASERLYSQIASESPKSIEAQLDWSVSENNLASSLQHAGRNEEAAKSFASAIGTQRELLASGPSNRVRTQLATSLNNLGLLLADVGAEEEAEASYREAIGLLSPTEDSVGEADDPLQLASVLANLSGLLSQSDAEQSIEHAQQALSIQTARLQKDRSSPHLATDTIVTLNTLGTAQLTEGQVRSAIESFDRSIEISRQLVARWPTQPTYRRDLVISLNHLALAQSKGGKLHLARRSFEQALTLQRSLAAEFAGDAETHSMLGGLLNNLGFLHAQLGDNVSAAGSYTEAAEQQAVAVELAPDVERYRQHLKKHRHNLSELGEAT